jgi:hypothetical protein
MATTHDKGPATLAQPRGRPFVKGAPRIAGRPKGGQNKTSKTVRESILEVARRLGGADRLLEFVMEHPRHEERFWLELWPRLLPLRLQGTGPHGEIEHTVAIDAAELTRKLAERGLPAIVFGACEPEPTIDVTPKQIAPPGQAVTKNAVTINRTVTENGGIIVTGGDGLDHDGAVRTTSGGDAAR